MSKKTKLDQLIEDTDIERMPDKDLWAGIEHAIEAQLYQNTSSSRQAFAMVASILLVVVVGVIGFYSGQQSQSEKIVKQLSDDFLTQREALLTKFSNVAVTTSNFQQQLIELDQAAQAIKNALKEDPDNPVLLQMLKRVYTQQIALIEKSHAPQWQNI